ncbi:caspase family protein [Variovorax sp. PCZ-1]|uniref:caspase family protein n=1 Tax=Variovorax sp. PCZ-1 TaxID=2835533 RepID=UPI001BCEA8E4|nr:caspase family protein [Variovorax sp. PCZ-1]MBS7806150.1 caspase family protein [Variovorax sp. PCZ-1]
MRKALIVGINYYCSVSSLYGCVDDAHAVRAILERNSDGTVNFSTVLLTGTGPTDLVNRATLRARLQDLFDGSGNFETALFYFAGHGHVESTGGYLLASDTSSGNDGLSLSDVLTFANQSKARNRIIILDSCHSGSAGASLIASDFAEVKEGTTILTASTASQYANEQNGAGVFTTLLVDALSGAAGNLVGEVTPGSIYAHIDQSLGPWDQRPVFKTNVQNFVSLRRVQPPIALTELQRITEFFPVHGQDFPLDPTFEPERQAGEASIPPPDPLNTAKFAILQKYNRVGLVVPVDAPHMWHAAMGSKACRLTVLGEHYRRLREKGRI